MKLSVTLLVINSVREGISASSGRAWKSQDIVVTWPEALSDGRVVNNYQLCTLRGEEVDRFAQLNPQHGMTLEVDIAFNTRQYNGRVYNENTIYLS